MQVNNDHLVSIIIPTYSRNDLLERAIASVLASTYKNIEIIVVDDNHADSKYRKETEEIMRKYSDNAQLHYVKNERNLGGAGARNEGIKASRGEYIAFLDDDDIYYPEKIQKQLEFFEQANNDKLALVYCYVEQIGCDEKVNYILKNNMRGNCLYESMCSDCIAPTSLWLVKKSALIDIGYFSIVPCKQDSTVLLKLLVKGYEIDVVPEVLCRYTNFGDATRISQFGPKNIQGELLYREACRKNFDKLSRSQAKDVEYAFALRLFHMYSVNKMDIQKRQERNRIWRMHPHKTVLYFTRRLLHSIKHRHK
jgi:glycosyltransferase involved in cell wall biosynthesis